MAKSQFSKKKQETLEYPSRLVWAIALFLIIIFITTLYYLHSITLPIRAFHAVTALLNTSVLENKLPSVHYHYYRSLEEARTAELNPPTTTTLPMPTQKIFPIIHHDKLPHPQATNTTTLSYFIQIASYPHYRDATATKTKLVSKGYKVRIQTANIKDGTWYRILLGPYNDLNMVRNIQKQFTTNQEAPLLIVSLK